MFRSSWAVFVVGFGCASVAVYAGTPSAATFTYQGQLKQDGVPYTGDADFEIADFAAPDGSGASLGNLRLMDIAVENGLFALDLTLDSAWFDGGPRWLGIAVRTPHDPAGRSRGHGVERAASGATRAYAIHAFNVPSIEETTWRNNGPEHQVLLDFSDHRHARVRWNSVSQP